MAKEWRDLIDGEIEELFIVLSDETRRKIIKVLDGGVEMNVTEIAGHFKLSRPNISHHLGIMKRAGVLGVKKDGNENNYFVCKDRFVKVLKKYIEDIDARCC